VTSLSAGQSLIAVDDAGPGPDLMTTVPQTNAVEIGLVSSALETDYEVLEELGRGGMAVVYRAREKALDREVAIKVLPTVLSLDTGFVERFEREAKTAAQLEHPSIVPIYRVGRSGSVIFFVMKFLRGQSLSAVMRERQKLTVDEVKRILLDCASALGYAARRGVVHRDIKPDNILLDHDGRCVITDFGIAKTQSGPLTAAGTSMGTPRYMSPEHAQGHPLDGRSDMYSLGVVAYQALAQSVPFDGPDPFAVLYKHINSPLPIPELATPEEKELFAIIEKMLQKKPEDRFQTADDLIAALGGPTTPTSATLVTGIMASRLVVEKTEIIPTGPVAHAKRFFRKQLPIWVAIPVAGVLSAGVYFMLKPPARFGGSAASTATKTTTKAPALPPISILPGTVASPLPTGGDTKAAAAPVVPKPKNIPPSKCPAAPKEFSLLTDSIRNQRQGSKLQVNFDVCGLNEDDAFITDITVRRIGQNRFSRLVQGGVRPLNESYPSVAIGPRTRRNRVVDISAMPPGRYQLDLVVTDAKKREVNASRQFEILEKK